MILQSPIYMPEDEGLGDQIIRFCENEIAPHREAWEEAEQFPRALYKKAGDARALSLGFSEKYEGSGWGVSLLLIPKEILGLTQTSLKKLGWWTSDIATLHFDNFRVPAINLAAQRKLWFPGDDGKF